MAELDIFNPQVSTVAKSLDSKIILVYGANNLGKTKQATRMKNPFYLPFESSGINAIAGIPFVPINKWSDFVKINKQLTDPATVQRSRSLYSTIIFDSLDASALFCQEYICQKYGAASIAEGNRGYGLWQQYASEYWKQINKLVGAGYCVYFIAHEKIDDNGYASPKADSRSLDPVINNADICVYVKSNGVDENGKVIKSSGYLADDPKSHFARSRFDYLPTTFIEEFTAENLEKVIIEAIEAQEKAEGIKAVTPEEQAATRKVDHKSYDELMDELGGLGLQLHNLGYDDELERIVTENLGEGKKANELKKGQEQQIETIIYDIQSFMANNGISIDED